MLVDLGIEALNFRDLNDLIANMTSNIFSFIIEGITSEMMRTNLVPFPHANFVAHFFLLLFLLSFLFVCFFCYKVFIPILK